MKICLVCADAAVVNIVDGLVAKALDVVVVIVPLLSGRRCLADLGRSKIPQLFRLLFNGGIVVQQAIFVIIIVG